MKRLLITALITALMSPTALAQTLTIETDAGTLEQKDASYSAPDYSPFVDRNIANRVLWGDTHLHTSYSADASYTPTPSAIPCSRLIGWTPISIRSSGPSTTSA